MLRLIHRSRQLPCSIAACYIGSRLADGCDRVYIVEYGSWDVTSDTDKRIEA